MELKGKKIVFLGDSITQGVGVSDIPNCRYDNVLKRELELAAVYNHGISGTRIAHQTSVSECPRHDMNFCGRLYDITRGADIVVVFGGTNDYFRGDAPMGELGDRTPATFAGAVRFLMERLPAEYPDIKVVFVTPARFSFDGMDGTEPSNHPYKKGRGYPLADYINMIKETGKLCSVPVLDLYEGLGIDPTIPEDKEKYTADGVHFNDAGHAIIAEKLGEFLKSL